MRVRLIARVKNDHLYAARIAAGFSTVAELSRATGIDQGSLGRYENFKDFPPENSKHTRPLEAALKMPWDALFPEEYRLVANKSFRNRVEAAREYAMLPGPEDDRFILPDPANTYEQAERDEIINDSLESALQNLTTREARVLNLHFGLNGEKEHTLAEVGRLMFVSAGRVRQIEAKAIRKLQHPSRWRGPVRDLVRW